MLCPFSVLVPDCSTFFRYWVARFTYRYNYNIFIHEHNDLQGLQATLAKLFGID